MELCHRSSQYYYSFRTPVTEDYRRGDTGTPDRPAPSQEFLYAAGSLLLQLCHRSSQYYYSFSVPVTEDYRAWPIR